MELLIWYAPLIITLGVTHVQSAHGQKEFPAVPEELLQYPVHIHPLDDEVKLHEHFRVFNAVLHTRGSRPVSDEGLHLRFPHHQRHRGGRCVFRRGSGREGGIHQRES